MTHLRNKFPIALSGPSGSGKSTIIHKLLHIYHQYQLQISYTTRQPRPGEENGVHYHFINPQTFQTKIQNNELVEWVYIYNNYYGTGKTSNNSSTIYDVDLKGIKSLNDLYPSVLTILILPPSIKELHRRINDREGCPLEKQNRITKLTKYDNNDINFFRYITINHTIHNTIEDICKIIQVYDMALSKADILLNYNKS